MRGLKDRTVLITGGANGIGAAIARRLAEEGCAVGILDRDAAAGEKIAGEIKAAGGRVSPHAVDITDQFTLKVAALKAHATQTSHMEIEAVMRDRAAAVAATAGLPAGRLAEAFTVLRTQ